jgi:hypothetical protein
MRARLTNKIQFEEEMSKIKYLLDSIKFSKGLIEFMKSLIARKMDFEVNLGFNWKKLKFWVKL